MTRYEEWISIKMYSIFGKCVSYHHQKLLISNKNYYFAAIFHFNYNLYHVEKELKWWRKQIYERAWTKANAGTSPKSCWLFVRHAVRPSTSLSIFICRRKINMTERAVRLRIISISNVACNRKYNFPFLFCLRPHLLLVCYSPIHSSSIITGLRRFTFFPPSN